MLKSNNLWKWIAAPALLLTVTAFSPLVIPAGIDSPWFMGLPRTLWTGLMISILFSILTVISAAVVSYHEYDEGDVE